MQTADGRRRTTDDQRQVTDARRLLLAGLVDFAGLFPPAALSMADAVRRYHEYRHGTQAWALGKFVLSVARLKEFGSAALPLVVAGDPWPLSVIAGSDLEADAAAIDDFVRRAADRAVIDAFEVKAATAGDVVSIARLAATLRSGIAREFDTYVEVAIADDPSPMISAIGANGLRAKVRTGGVQAGAFPSAAQLTRFLNACAAYGVKFKATAGLHHAVRGTYPLTYERESERGVMFGFLNVFLAAAFVRDGLGAADTNALLEERDVNAFKFSAAGVSWHGRTVTTPSIRLSRAHAAASFGSCSFAEPMADLLALGLL